VIFAILALALLIPIFVLAYVVERSYAKAVESAEETLDNLQILE
jgi:hypothetical protein